MISIDSQPTLNAVSSIPEPALALARRLLLGGYPSVLESQIDPTLQILSLHQMAEEKGKQLIKPMTYRKRTLQVDGSRHDVFIADDCASIDATGLLKKWLLKPHEPLSKW